MNERSVIGLESYGLKLRATNLLSKLRAVSFELRAARCAGKVSAKDAEDETKPNSISMKNFKKLKIWQKGMNIVLNAYKLAKQLPAEERFGLALQITKSAVSIPSNISEGSAKSSMLDNKRFLEIALGSAYELETQVLIADLLSYGDKELREILLKDVDEEQKMIQSYINRIMS